MSLQRDFEQRLVDEKWNMQTQRNQTEHQVRTLETKLHQCESSKQSILG